MEQIDANTGLPLTEVIRSFFASDASAVLVLLHGSFASGRQRADSDVDLAVLYHEPLSSDDMVKKAQDLGHILRREVDLVDLSVCHGAILQESLVRGRQLLVRDPERLAQLLRRMWYEQEDDARFAAKTISARRALWDR